MADWTFLTNHAHVLVLLARDARTRPDALAREIGIDEAEVEEILVDLESAGYLETRRGEPTVRIIDRHAHLRHPIEAHHEVGRLLDAVESPGDVLTRRVLRDR